MKNRWRRNVVVAASVLLAAAAVAVVGGRAKVRATAALAPLPIVEVAPVVERNVPISREWVGTLAGMVTADVKAQASGYLLRRDYREGSFVHKGQLLFEIDPRPFQAALDQARGRLAAAEAQLSQGEAQLATAKANQLESQLNVERDTPLEKAKAVSRQILDDEVQTNLANVARVKGAEAAIAAARAGIQAGRAAVEAASIHLGFTRITSPISGIAGIAQAQVGDLVSSASGPLTTVSTVDPIRDYFSVSGHEYLEIEKQLGGTDPRNWKLELILADDTPYTEQGRFYFADRAVDPATGSIKLAGVFPNPGNVLRPGQYGKIRAVIGTEKNALLIPQAAITQLQGGYEVEVLGRDNRIRVQPVHVGGEVGAEQVVLRGLHPGERVVVEGGQNVRPGMRVQPRPYRTGKE